MPWFEDIPIGQTTVLGHHDFTVEEIMAFARLYDPQSFHVDPEAATQSHFGGLVASGWHTAAMWMKLAIRARQAAPQDDDSPAGGPSPGFLDLRWPHPVRPGDRVHYRSRIVEKRDFPSRPDWGLVRSLNEGHNQDGRLVLSFIGQGLIRRRTDKA